MNAGATTIISFLILVVAFMQWRTAHKKVVLDLFDRRWRCYMAILDASRNLLNGTPDSGLVITLGRAANEASFLFGNDVVDCLNRVQKVASTLSAAEVVIRNTDNPQHQLWLDRKHEGVMQVLAFFDDFPRLCEPYMRMAEKQVRTPAEWFRNRNKTRLGYADKE